MDRAWLLSGYFINYTVTFNTDESGKTDQIGSGEQKIERLKLLDVTPKEKAVSAIDFDAIAGLDSIEVSNITVTRADNSNKVSI